MTRQSMLTVRIESRAGLSADLPAATARKRSMDRRVKPGGDEGIGPRIGDKLLDARHKIGYKHLRISLTEGRIPDAILTAERVRMRARGLANRSRAALGHRSAGKRTGPYGAY
jgi:hypothetical protein